MDGTAVATGLGWDAELRFNEVMVPAAGRYILRIIYAAGDCRDISIQANDGEVINTYLHSTSGWEFPTWEYVGEKEVLIDLQEGKNRIRMFNDHGLISHIRGDRADSKIKKCRNNKCFVGLFKKDNNI